MTGDYLACIARPAAPARAPPKLKDALQRRGFRMRFNSPGVVLFAGDRVPVRQCEDGGMLIGTIFGSGSDADPAGAALQRAAPTEILERCWGSYVIVSPSDDEWQVTRDPSGGLACYWALVDGRHFFTSAPHLLVDCGLVAGSIEWPELVRSLADHSSRSRETAIRGIAEVLPGTSLRIGAMATSERRVWNPWHYANRKAPDDCAEALRDTLCATLECWGQSLSHPLIEISGGLDSAVVASGLAAASPRASLITFAAAPGDPDETAYANAVARHLGLELTIVHPSTLTVDLGRSLSSDLPRPNARAFTQAADALSLSHAQAIGADAFVSGGGGDDLFCYLRTVLPAIDRLHAEGTRAMVSSLLDIAVMNHSTFWEALQRTVRRLIRRRSGRDALDLRFLNAASARAVARPALECSRERLPGKADHVRNILSIHNYLEGHARSEFAPIISPLLSQPVVECCLSIPTWCWCSGGRNRSVARDAFAGRLPPEVIERRSKGHFDGFCASLFEANRDLVRAMLLDGELARQELLDRDSIRAALSDPFPSAETITRLLALVDAESWAASWRSRPIQRA